MSSSRFLSNLTSHRQAIGSGIPDSSAFASTFVHSPPHISPSEKALNDLIDALRVPPASRGASKNAKAHSVRAPSFLSGGLPRDHRDRIAQKRDLEDLGIAAEDEEGWDEGGETPRNGFTGTAALDMERERTRVLGGIAKSRSDQQHWMEGSVFLL